MKGESRQPPKKKWDKKKIFFRVLIFFVGFIIGAIALLGLAVWGLFKVLFEL